MSEKSAMRSLSPEMRGEMASERKAWLRSVSASEFQIHEDKEGEYINKGDGVKLRLPIHLQLRNIQ